MRNKYFLKIEEFKKIGHDISNVYFIDLFQAINHHFKCYNKVHNEKCKPKILTEKQYGSILIKVTKEFRKKYVDKE
jgi:hypothetical protein